MAATPASVPWSSPIHLEMASVEQAPVLVPTNIQSSMQQSLFAELKLQLGGTASIDSFSRVKSSFRALFTVIACAYAVMHGHHEAFQLMRHILNSLLRRNMAGSLESLYDAYWQTRMSDDIQWRPKMQVIFRLNFFMPRDWRPVETGTRYIY